MATANFQAMGDTVAIESTARIELDGRRLAGLRHLGLRHRLPFYPSVIPTTDGRRIGVYQHSAAGRDLLSEALRRLGATMIDIGRTDHFVPVDTEAVGPDDAAKFRRWVAENDLEVLVSTDGDGDRPLLVDETGIVLRGDALGALTARHLGADAIATPLNSSTAVERCGWFSAPDDVVWNLNTTPRKCLRYRTPIEAFAINLGVALEMRIQLAPGASRFSTPFSVRC